MDDAPLPSRYFFVIRWPDGEHDDPEGTPFRSSSAALAYAFRIVRELKDAGGYDEPGMTLVVENALGETLFAIPF